MLRAAEASSLTAGGAWEFSNAVLVVVATASRHGAAHHFLACCFTAETQMIAWGDSVEGAGLMSVKKQQHLTRTSTMTPQLGALTILTL